MTRIDSKMVTPFGVSMLLLVGNAQLKQKQHGIITLMIAMTLAVKNTRANSIIFETTTTTTATMTTCLVDLTSSQQPAKKKRKISELQTTANTRD